MSAIKPTLVVLAAGMGSRYGGLKQLDPVGPQGETIIDYSVHDAASAGFAKLVFVIRRDIEDAFRTTIGRRFEKRIPVDYAFQELDSLPDGYVVPASRKKPWGTGHAVLVAEPVVDGPFAVINADDFYGRRSFELLAQSLTSPAAAAGDDIERYVMIGFILRQTLSDHGHVSRGVCRLDSRNRLQGITEIVGILKDGQAARYPDADGLMRPLTADEIVSMNCWGFTPSIFSRLREQFIDFMNRKAPEEKAAAQPEFFLPSVVHGMIAAGKAEVEVLTTPDSWFGVTYREDKPHVEHGVRALIDQGVYAEHLWG